MSEFVQYFQAQENALVAALGDLVSIESPSSDKAAVDRMSSRVETLFRQAGAAVQRIAGQTTGDMVLGSWHAGRPGQPVTLLCHMDTVWPLGTLAQMPLRQADGKLFGPGGYDMKSGIVIALAALQGLQALGGATVSPVNILCTGDEEVGSGASRALIEELAGKSQLVLVLEPSLPGGVIKTARKGVGEYLLRVEGRSAHAGADHKKGRNAIEEMAHQVLALQRLTDYEKSTTVNVGVIRGGTASNVVPAACEVDIDFRITRHEEAARLEKAIGGLAPVLEGTRLHISGGLNRPPMVRDARMAAAFAKAQQIGARYGMALTEGSAGGASDGNFTSVLTPTLDGLGADGDGAHAVHEHVLISSLPQRAALVAALLSEW